MFVRYCCPFQSQPLLFQSLIPQMIPQVLTFQGKNISSKSKFFPNPMIIPNSSKFPNTSKHQRFVLPNLRIHRGPLGSWWLAMEWKKAPASLGSLKVGFTFSANNSCNRGEFWIGRSLCVKVYITMEKSWNITIFECFWWVNQLEWPFPIAMLNYQRVGIFNKPWV